MTKTALHSICVFCGSSMGAQPDYATAARELGKALALQDIRLVYGGAKRGLMGVLADSVLEAGGRVIGVIPHSLASKEIAHAGLTELRIVDSMHDRKAQMAELADGFVAMPGGFGTFEEFFEVVTWSQLGIHRKPCGLLNVAGYFDPLIQLTEHGIREQFIKADHGSIIIVEPDPSSLLTRMRAYHAPHVHKWIGLDQT